MSMRVEANFLLENGRFFLVAVRLIHKINYVAEQKNIFFIFCLAFVANFKSLILKELFSAFGIGILLQPASSLGFRPVKRDLSTKLSTGFVNN